MVILGGYTNNVDQVDLIEYTVKGSDARNWKHALITSCWLKTLVCVIWTRLFKEYSYGGLFEVIDYKDEAEKDGHKVYKFALKKIIKV